MPDTHPQSSPPSASKSWALLRVYLLLGAIVFVLMYLFANMPSEIGESYLPDPPNGSKTPPYFAITTIALRDIPANTVLTRDDVGAGRVYIRSGIRRDLTIDSFEDPASVVGFRTKFKLYQNQEISKWDFENPVWYYKRVVVCRSDISRGTLLTRQNIALAWVGDPKEHSRFGFNDLNDVLGHHTAGGLSRGQFIIDRDLMENSP